MSENVTKTLNVNGLTASKIVSKIKSMKWFKPYSYDETSGRSTTGVEYRFSNTKKPETIHIGTPAYINIRVDDRFRIEYNDTTINIYNKILCVTLWRETQIMHVTVFDFKLDKVD